MPVCHINTGIMALLPIERVICDMCLIELEYWTLCQTYLSRKVLMEEAVIFQPEPATNNEKQVLKKVTKIRKLAYFREFSDG